MAGAARLGTPPLIRLAGIVNRSSLDYDDAIVAEVDAERLAKLRGEYHPHPLDAHRTLLRLKLAGLFAVLDNRTTVDCDDWELVRRLLRLSDLTRAVVVEHIASEARQREQSQIDRHVRRELAAVDSAERRAFLAAARAIGRRAHRDPSEVLPRRLLSQAVKGADRSNVDFDAVLDHAMSEGWLAAEPDGYRAGRSQPS